MNEERVRRHDQIQVMRWPPASAPPVVQVQEAEFPLTSSGDVQTTIIVVSSSGRRLGRSRRGRRGRADRSFAGRCRAATPEPVDSEVRRSSESESSRKAQPVPAPEPA